MAGYEPVAVRSDARGGVDLDDLREAIADGDIAGLMLTNPNTLGLFDEHIVEIARLVHEAGGLLYYDGANLNAVLGISRGPATWASTSSTSTCTRRSRTPHGGGGPGRRAHRGARHAGAVPAGAAGGRGATDGRFSSTTTVRSRSARCAPSTATSACWCAPTPTSAASAPRACARSARRRCSTPTTCWRASATCFDVPYDRRCMHEFVSRRRRSSEHGVRALDVAKRLLDYGVHPPTMYFPLIVDEALMVEPTETESQGGARPPDRGALRAVGARPRDDPELLREAPRDDAGAAARRGAGRAPPGAAPAVPEDGTRRRRGAT